MRLLRVDKVSPETRVFGLSKQERDCLLAIVEYYPFLELYIQPLSKTGAVNSENQRLLEESMTEQRHARLRKLYEFLRGNPRIERDESGSFRLTLKAEEVEWLLQVLNEIRVGCWIRLGRPDTDDLAKRELNAADLRARTTMDLCGYFQVELMEASK